MMRETSRMMKFRVDLFILLSQSKRKTSILSHLNVYLNIRCNLLHSADY